MLNEDREDERDMYRADEPLDLLYDRTLNGVIIGRSSSEHQRMGRRGLLLLGELMEKDERIPGDAKVYLGAEYPHVVFICGKRGSGKSYTLGVFAEELARTSLEIATVIIDPIGIFWSLREKGEGMREELKRFGLRPHGFGNTVVMAPPAPGAPPPDTPLTISVSDLQPEDWMAIFDIEPFSQQGNLISDVLKKVKSGYRAMRGEGIEQVEGREDYTIEDIIRCIEEDTDVLSPEKGYSIQTRRSIISRFKAAQSWGIFARVGTPLDEIVRERAITVIDVSSPTLGDSKRALIAGILARKILLSRMGEVEIPVTWLLIDEAHLILPRGKRTAATEPLTEYAKLGRKPGCALVLATQRPSATDDEVLSQVDLVVAHTLAMKDDIKALMKRIPTHVPKSFSAPSFLRGLKPGEVLVGDQRGGGRAFMMKVRPRQSRHAGETTMPKSVRGREEKESPLKDVLRTLPPSILVESDEPETSLKDVLKHFSGMKGMILYGPGLYPPKYPGGGFNLRKLDKRGLRAQIQTAQQDLEEEGGGVLIIGGIEDNMGKMVPEEVASLFKEMRWRAVKGSGRAVLVLDYEITGEGVLKALEEIFDAVLLYRAGEGRWVRMEREERREKEESRIRVENRILKERLKKLEERYEELLMRLSMGEEVGEEGVKKLEEEIEEAKSAAGEDRAAKDYLKALEKDLTHLKKKHSIKKRRRGKKGKEEGSEKEERRKEKGRKKEEEEREVVREGKKRAKRPVKKGKERLKEAREEVEKEKSTIREAKVEWEEVVLPVIPPRIDSEWAGEEALKELNILTRRRSQVADVFPFFLPLLMVEATAPGKLLRKPKIFHLYVDLNRGELIMGWGKHLRRSEGFKDLLKLPPLEAKMLFYIASHHPITMKELKEDFKLPGEKVEEVVNSLMGRGLLREEVEEESGEVSYTLVKPFFLPKHLRRPLAELPSVAEEVVEEQALKVTVDEERVVKTLAFLEDRIRMGGRRRVYYPYYLVDVDTPKGLKRFAVDAVTGRVDRELKGLSRVDMVPLAPPKKLKLKMRSPERGGKPRRDRGPPDRDGN
ncbi:MAG: DUF853 family protein [Thermoplasmata archaeon]|nr:DUF853 family protein [Thermoplasmata archaeon]